jgi:hypothetical protein
VNYNLPVWVTWIDVLHRVGTWTFGFFCPGEGCSADAVTYPFVGFLLGLVCLQSTQGLYGGLVHAFSWIAWRWLRS